MAQLISAPAVAVIDENNILTINWQPIAGSDGGYDQYSYWNITTQAGVSSPVVVTKPVSPLNPGETNTNRIFTETLISSNYTLSMQAIAVSTFALSSVANASSGTTTYTGIITGGVANEYVGQTFVIAGFLTSANNGTFQCTASTNTTLTLSNTSGVTQIGAATATVSPSTEFNSLPWQTNGVSTARSFPTALSSSLLAFSNTTVLLGQPLTVTLNSSYTGADQWQVLWPDNTSTGWLPLSSNVVAKQFAAPGAENVVIQTRRNYSGNQYNPPTTLLRQFTQQIFVMNQQAPNTSSTTGGLTGDLGIGGQQGFEIIDATSAATTPEPWEMIARALVRDTITNELKLLIATSRFSNASSLFGTMAVDVFPIEGRPHTKELIVPPYELATTSQTESIPVKIGTGTLPNLIVGKSVTDALGGVFTMSTKTQSGVSPFIWSFVGLPPGVTMNSSGVINGTPLALGLFQVTFAVQDSSLPFSIDEVTLPLLIETDLLVQVASGQTDANNNAIAPLGTSLGVVQVGTPVHIQMQVGNINPNATTPGGLQPYLWDTPAGALPTGLSIDPNTGIISGVPCTYNSTADYSKTFTVTVQVTDAINARASQTYTLTIEPAHLQFGHIDQPTIFSAEDFKLVVPVFGGYSPYTFDSFEPPVSDSSYYTDYYSDGPPSSIVDGQIEVPVNMPTAKTGSHTFSLSVTDSSSTAISTQFSYSVNNEVSDIRIVPGWVSHVWDYNDTASASALPISGNLSGFTLEGLRLNLTSSAAASGGNTVYTGIITGGGSNAYVGDSFVVSGFFFSANNGTFSCTASSASTITLNNPNGVVEPLVLTLSSVANAVSGSAVYTGTITGGASNAYAGVSFTVTGFSTTANNGTFSCSASTSTTLTLSNASAVAQTQAAAATIALTAKALQATILSNGITVALDPTIPDVEVNGPAGPVFRNSEYRVPLVLQQGNTNVATISRAYTFLCHDDQATPGDIGTIQTYLRPMIVGELIGLNPRKPYYDSPKIASFNSSWIARVQDGSALPPGLSLDANTGLIYGTLTGVYSSNSIIEYADASGTVHGTITINWNTIFSNFSLIDNIVDGLPISTPYSQVLTAPTGISLVSASLFYGSLPAGLSLSISGQDVVISGTPTEAGYFDVWIQANSTNSQSAFAYHRLVIDYIKPLTIVNSSLPSISAQPYSVTLQGFGGIPPYTSWTSPQFPSGTGSGNFLGLTLVTNTNGTGTISGTLSSPPGSSPTDLGDISITLTDTRGSSSAVTSNFDLTYDNRLRITTPQPNGIPVITNDPNGYAFSMQAAGGVPPYYWELITPGSPTSGLPSGITFDAINSYGPTGSFSGIWPGTSYVASSFTINLKDSTSPTPQVVSGVFTIQTGTATLIIDDSGAGLIPRGEVYQGSLAIEGTYTTPITWQVAPTATFPNNILPGLFLQASASNGGQTATIAGTYSGVPHTIQSPVTITNVARAGTLATITANNNLQPGDKVIVAGLTNTALNGSYIVVSVNGTFPSSSTQFTYNTSTSGTISSQPDSGTATGEGYNIRVVAVDNASHTDAASIPLNTTTDLAITTTSLPNAIVGGSYSNQLTAINGVPPYTWTSSPSFPFNGLAMSSGGLITGAATSIFSQNFVFTVSDSISNSVNATIALDSQASGLNFTTIGLPSVVSGRPYSTVIAATGSPNTPYAFTISPLSANQLPTGLVLSATSSTTATISGTTILTGFSKPVTFRVTDSIGANVDQTFTVTVVAGLTLVTGVDYIDSLSTGILGYVVNGSVDSINPRPNDSFYVIATGVVSTNVNQVQVSIGNSNITATVQGIVDGVAPIKLSGSGFPNAEIGNNILSITVTDSGVTVSGTFTWVVYSDGALRLTPSSGTFPTQLLSSS